MEIPTSRLTLILQTPQQVLAAIEALSPELRAEVSPRWLEQIRNSTVSDPWMHSFRIVLRGSSVEVGSCGYKGPPDADGMVEIAYAVDEAHRRQGYATEAAQALVDHARQSGQVRLVRAHTLPEPNASTRVLSKCGFFHRGEVMDPEDGRVWRWELPTAST